MKRRKWSPERKALMVLEVLQGRSIGEVARSVQRASGSRADNLFEYPVSACAVVEGLKSFHILE